VTKDFIKVEESVSNGLFLGAIKLAVVIAISNKVNSLCDKIKLKDKKEVNQK